MTKTGILLAAIALLAPLSCRNRGEALSQEEYSEESIEDIVELTPAQMSAVGITVGPVERRTLSETVQTSGSLKLSPQSQAEVTSLVNGKVRRILAKQGQSVRAGETLALVENTEIVSLQKDYLIATRQAELSASAFESSVLPTPVGPKKRKLPIGFDASFIPAFALIIASVTRLTASS